MLVTTRDVQANQQTATPSPTAPQRRASPGAAGLGRESSSYQSWPAQTLRACAIVKAEARFHP